MAKGGRPRQKLREAARALIAETKFPQQALSKKAKQEAQG
jgi:hypothetical protein